MIGAAALAVRTGQDHRFYVAAGAAAFAIIFAGFARTYFFRTLFGLPALPWLLHLHGFLMTSWFALFIHAGETQNTDGKWVKSDEETCVRRK